MENPEIEALLNNTSRSLSMAEYELCLEYGKRLLERAALSNYIIAVVLLLAAVGALFEHIEMAAVVLFTLAANFRLKCGVHDTTLQVLHSQRMLAMLINGALQHSVSGPPDLKGASRPRIDPQLAP